MTIDMEQLLECVLCVVALTVLIWTWHMHEKFRLNHVKHSLFVAYLQRGDRVSLVTPVMHLDKPVYEARILWVDAECGAAHCSYPVGRQSTDNLRPHMVVK